MRLLAVSTVQHHKSGAHISISKMLWLLKGTCGQFVSQRSHYDVPLKGPLPTGIGWAKITLLLALPLSHKAVLVRFY